MKIKDQIKAWKEKYGTVVEVPFDDGKSAFFKNPNRRELKLIYSKAAKGGPIAMVESYVANCWLGGDLGKDEILNPEDTSYISQLTASIDDLLQTKKVEIKKH